MLCCQLRSQPTKTPWPSVYKNSWSSISVTGSGAVPISVMFLVVIGSPLSTAAYKELLYLSAITEYIPLSCSLIYTNLYCKVCTSVLCKI